MNSIRISTVIILTLIANLSFSQHTYLPGYLIQLDGDTTHGYIDYRNWKLNPEVILFKPNEKGISTRFFPESILGFSVDDAKYESAIVNKEGYLNLFGKQKFDPVVNTVKDTVFLKTLTGGTKSLLYLRNDDGIDQYYIKQGDVYDLLLYKRYLKVQEGRTGYMENKTYIGQLIDYLRDCTSIPGSMSGIRYKKDELEKLFLQYYKCTNSAAAFIRQPDKKITEFGAMIGFSSTSTRLNNTNQFASVSFPSSSMISAGIFFNRVYPHNQHKFSWNHALLYTSYKTSGHFDDHFTPASLHFEYSYIKWRSTVRYNYPLKTIFLYGGLGVSIGIPVRTKNEVIDESIFHPAVISQATGIGGGELGGVFQAGIKFRKYLLEFNYEAITSTTTKRLYLFLGYRFK